MQAPVSSGHRAQKCVSANKTQRLHFFIKRPLQTEPTVEEENWQTIGGVAGLCIIQLKTKGFSTITATRALKKQG